MKKLFLLITLAFVAMSCEMIDEKIDDLLDKRDWVVFAEGTELTANVPSKQTVLNYKFESALDWEVKTGDEWLEIDPMSGKAGKDIKIQIKVAKNKEKTSRTGYVHLSLTNNESYHITINQAGEGNENEDVVVDIPNNQIWYTSTDGEIVVPYSGEHNNYADAFTTFGVNIVSNTYVDGKGVIEFDGDVTTMGYVAFYNCSSLTSVTIPDSVTTIGGYAFGGCHSLTSVTIGDSVTAIGDYAFGWCEGLTSITIPDRVTNIGYAVFALCENLKTVYCKAINPPTTIVNNNGYWCGFAMQDENGLYDIDCTIYVYAECVDDFKNAPGWSEYADRIVADGNIPEDTAISIIRYTTIDGAPITPQNMKIKSNKYIDGEGVLEFYGTSIGPQAFLFNTNLSSVTIGDSVTTIGSVAFCWCENLTSVIIPDSVTTIGDSAFSCCSSLTSITLPDSLTRIEQYAFSTCTNLTTITIPESVTSIGEAAFTNCSSLQEFNGKFASDDGKCLVVDGVLNSFAVGCGATEYTIPDSVTTIGYGAFALCSSLTSVTIPDSVTTIASFVFDGCTNLQEFNGKFASDDGKCLVVDGALNYFAIGCGATEYTIPDSVTTIGWSAFAYCDSLTSVTIGDSVTTIREGAFQGCSSLTSVTIPNSVTTIGSGAFSACSSLTSVTIPDSVTVIEDTTFIFCYSLTSVDIPDSVTSIGNNAFQDCRNLDSVTIPDSVTSIGNYAFGNCTSLISVFCKATTPPTAELYNGHWYAFNSNAYNRIIYVPMESVEAYKSANGWSEYADAIVGYNFENGEVVVPDTDSSKPANNEIWYTSVDGEIVEPYSGGDNNYADAFTTFGVNIVSNTYVDGKGVIEFDGDVTTFGGYAFYNCHSLTSVTIPDSVISIGDWAFLGCKGLTSVTIPDSVTTIGDGAFLDCSSLTEFRGKYASDNGRCLIIDGTLNSFAPAGLAEYTIPDSVTTIGERAFSSCSSLTSITIPDSVTTIGDCAFSGCYRLTSITIPDSVTTIGSCTFFYCSSLTSVTIPDSVTTIGFQAFCGCSSLTSVTIPDRVTTIGNYAFQYCSSLTSITIPDSVITIGNYAFQYCSSLTSVYCKPATPPTTEVYDNYWRTFDSNAYNRIIYVPMESVEAYKSANGWSDYADAIVGFEFGNGEVVVPDTDPSKPANNEIWYTNGSTSQPIRFPHGNLYDVFNLNIVSHTYNTEKGCWVIKCDGDITEITPEAFRSQKLISITLPESLIVLDEYAFQNCSELTSITLPESLTALSNFVFHNCSKLTSITLPKNVAGIGSFAFDGCTNLMRVYCESTNPPRGGESMFDKLVFGRKIYVPIGSKDSYQSAKSWNDYKYEIAGYDENYSKYHIGDIVSIDGVVGIVYEIVDGNVKVVSVEETSTSWGEYGVEVPTHDQYYGYNNMLVVQSMEDWKNKYPAFKWCADFGDGWYLPSIQELFDIYFVKNTLNEILVANGYTRLGSDNGSMQHYWSSTHSDGGNAEMLRDEGNGSYSWVADDKRSSYKVRAVRVL